MKLLVLLFLLFGLSACGFRKIGESAGKAIGEGLTCGIGGTVRSMFSNTVTIDQKHIDLVNAELQGRPFSTSAFWSRLSRETRLSLNIHLNRQLRVNDEEVVYQGTSLFFENLRTNGNESFEINSNGKTIVLVNDGDRSLPVRGSCRGNEKELRAVDTLKVIHESTLQHKKVCGVSGEELNLLIFENHIVTDIDGTLSGFSGGEVIRTDEDGKVSVEALNSFGETLKFVFDKDLRTIDVRLFGKSRSLVGTGNCH